jgi:hypothetical protein
VVLPVLQRWCYSLSASAAVLPARPHLAVSATGFCYSWRDALLRAVLRAAPGGVTVHQQMRCREGAASHGCRQCYYRRSPVLPAGDQDAARFSDCLLRRWLGRCFHGGRGRCYNPESCAVKGTGDRPRWSWTRNSPELDDSQRPSRPPHGMGSGTSCVHRV